MKNSIITASILATGLAFSGAANALQASQTLNVSANVIAACTVATTAVSFGNLVGIEAVFSNGGISVTCATGIPYHIALDAGLNPGGGGRWMKDVAGTARAIYWLKSDAYTLWGDSDYDNTYSVGASVAGTGNGSLQSHIVYGMAAGQDFGGGYSPPGQYSDTVNVTVYY